MFRKIITGLSYSPALIESLSKLATRLKHEVQLRRLGVVFLIIALLLQCVMLLNPPAASNAASVHDTIYGGFGTVERFMTAYDANQQHLRDMLTSLGITRYDITRASYQTSLQPDTVYTISATMKPDTPAAQLFHYRTSGDITDPSRQTAYVTTQATPPAHQHKTLYTGSTRQYDWFAINMTNGDVLVPTLPSTITARSVCPIDPLPKGRSCHDYYQQQAYNQTKSKQASQVVASSDDHILYSFTVRNPATADQPVTIPFQVNLYDVLEYATVTDSGGGIYDSQSGTITWPEITVQPGHAITHRATVKILHDIPATSQGVSNHASYDCQATSRLATTQLSLPLHCPLVKQLEDITTALPPMSLTLVITELVTVSIILYLFARSRQLKEEVRLIRKDLNSGALD